MRKMASATINGPPWSMHVVDQHASGPPCKVLQYSPRFIKIPHKIPLSDLYAKPSGGPGHPAPLLFCFCFPPPPAPPF